MSFLSVDHRDVKTLAANAAAQVSASELDRLESCLIEIGRIIQDKNIVLNTVPQINVEPKAPDIHINVPEQRLPEVRIDAPVSVAPAAITININPWAIIIAGVIPGVATLADIIIRIWFL